MKLSFFKIIAIITLTGLWLSPSISAVSPVLSPGLDKLVFPVDGPQSDSLVKVVVFLEDAGSSNKFAQKAAAMSNTRDERIKSVLSNLTSYQAPFADNVENFLNRNAVSLVHRYWIVPAFSVTLPVSAIEQLTNMEGVHRIVEDAPLSFDPPVKSSDAPAMSASVSAQLEQLNVPALWQQGLTGTGRLICSFDTGVESDHPALASKWRGNHASLSASWFSMVAPDTLPSDRTGHGTHTMGIMVGSDNGDTIGVAPGAEWITAGVIDQGRPLETTISDILEAFQWALNPDGDPNTTDDVPDVILNSWGIPKGLFEPCDPTFAQVINNVEAAGVVTIFAAGNEGPEPSTLRNPADMVLTPLTSFAVGAVDGNNEIASFSSRGPSSCDTTQIKPEVVAPGISIRSSYKGGGYKIMSGTSMAAPYIAGLVALMRQYNPDATVEEIKNALIASATDLGPAGEDNAYGHGLVDASRLLEYLSSPMAANFKLADVRYVDAGVALPGEQVRLEITISNAPGNVETAFGHIISLDPASAAILEDSSTFYFGPGGTTAVNSSTLMFTFGSDSYNGEEISLALVLEAGAGMPSDTLTFSITAGITPVGVFATHATPRLEFTVSDFGQYGLAPGSIYNVDGAGFRVNGSDNLLYEAGVIIGRNSHQLASAVRDSLGRFVPSDFSPVNSLSDAWTSSDGGVHRNASYMVSGSVDSLPVMVSQETISYPHIDNNGLVIIKYVLHNRSSEDIDSLSFGFMTDFDLEGPGEQVGYDREMKLVYQQSVAGPSVGIIGLHNVNSFEAIENGSSKTGFTRNELFDVISTQAGTFDSGPQGDWLTIALAGPFDIKAGDSVEITLGIVGGSGLLSVYENARTAKDLYDMSTDITDGADDALPGQFVLHQNYPNPFNPTTNIAFELATAGKATLTVYNVLGQEVAELHDGFLSAGSHEFTWDATNEQGTTVAGGIYFFKLTTSSQSQSRKMIFVK